MKFWKTIFAVFALSVAFTAPAKAGAVSTATCVPYTIPIQSTVTACGNGLMGSKYKTSTKSCPSGAITTSADYDTSGCMTAPPSAGTVNTATRCIVTPDACGTNPVAKGCTSGYHWTLIGTNIAHCVADDPACPWGTSLRHDAIGNPSCIQNTCPSNQVLQGDGISCACPVNTVWNGGSCVPAPPTCVAGAQRVNPAACGTGFSGTMYQIQTTTCPAGPYGSPSTTTSGYDTSTCTALPPSCSAGSWTEGTTCGDPSKYTGSMYRTDTTSCPWGAYGSPSTSYGAWNTSACGCANGALNYPSCLISNPNPFDGTISGGTVSMWAENVGASVGPQEYFYLNTDGTWRADIPGNSHVYNPGPTGRWLASGFNASDYEIYWTGTKRWNHYEIGRGVDRYEYPFFANIPADAWADLSRGFSGYFSTGNTEITVTIRKKSNPSITATFKVQFASDFGLPSGA